jgi:hypothetical protein
VHACFPTHSIDRVERETFDEKLDDLRSGMLEALHDNLASERRRWQDKLAKQRSLVDTLRQTVEVLSTQVLWRSSLLCVVSLLLRITFVFHCDCCCFLLRLLGADLLFVC